MTTEAVRNSDYGRDVNALMQDRVYSKSSLWTKTKNVALPTIKFILPALYFYVLNTALNQVGHSRPSDADEIFGALINVYATIWLLHRCADAENELDDRINDLENSIYNKKQQQISVRKASKYAIQVFKYVCAAALLAKSSPTWDGVFAATGAVCCWLPNHPNRERKID